MKITQGTKEWADKNVNVVEGCYNNCRYCYAKRNAIRFHRKTEESWWIMHVNQKAVNKSYRKIPGRIMFPTSHDIFPISIFESGNHACFIVLDKLLKAKNNVLITTKPRFEVVKDICREFEKFKEQIQFRFTITSKDMAILTFWEPNATKYIERIESLKHAWRYGFKTSISVEPFLDSSPEFIIADCLPFITESVWIGIMTGIKKNNIMELERPFYDQIRENYSIENLRYIYNRFKNVEKIRFKDNFLNKLRNAGVHL